MITAVLPRARCVPLLRNGCLSLEQLKQIHANMITCGIYKQASAIGRLVECCTRVQQQEEGMGYARLVFERIEKPDTFTWNVMIRCAATIDEAFSVYTQLLAGPAVPDKFTFTVVISACSRSAAMLEGKQTHTQIVKNGFAKDLVVQTTIIHFYARCGDVGSARQVFDEMPERNNITCNAMIAGYSSQVSETDHNAKEALLLFRDMLLVGGERRPSETTAVAVLSSCARLAVLATGRCVHVFIYKTLPSLDKDVFVGTGLVDMYSKCGCISSAWRVFETMKVANVQTWSAMISGLAIHGQGKEALELLDEMGSKGVAPNSVTFTSLLSACRHAGLIKEGLRVFESMSGRFGVEPRIEHYGCVVDLLGRAGLLEEACEFITRMPFEADLVVWRTLLAACKMHGNVEVGDRVGKLLLGLEADDSCHQDYVALSNVYASAGRWEDVDKLRKTMKVRGIRNKAGRSSVQVYGAVREIERSRERERVYLGEKYI